MTLSTGPSRKITTLKPQIESIPLLPGQQKVVQSEKKKNKTKTEHLNNSEEFHTCCRIILNSFCFFIRRNSEPSQRNTIILQVPSSFKSPPLAQLRVLILKSMGFLHVLYRVYKYLCHMKYCTVKGKEEALFVTKCITRLRTWSSTVIQTL